MNSTYDESPKLKGLFLNTSKANCSIYESGKMCFDCLVLSSLYSLDYQEIDEYSRDISLNYDFYVFNYHHISMGWLNTKEIKYLPGFKATIVLEVLPNNPFVIFSNDDFDAYLVLDPTLISHYQNVYPFPRPLEEIDPPYLYNVKSIPVIGSFGFATKDKGFDLVIKAVNKEFDEAIVKINIPKGDYIPSDHFNKLISGLKNINTKDGIKVEITNVYHSKSELIEWCSQNTLNLFLYHRNMPGLSATTDQAISSGRPLAVSTDNTFRHLHKYLIPYPFQSLKESIKNSEVIVKRIQQDWKSREFYTVFENMIKENQIIIINKSGKKYTLPIYAKPQVKNKYGLKKSDFIPPILLRIMNKLKSKFNIQEKLIKNLPLKTLTPFVHYALNSFSQHNEDLLIDLLLGMKENGFYVDVGANDPCFNSNTNRFYLRGWNGINIEPHKKAFGKFLKARPFDINLNIAISEKEGLLTFYLLSDDSTISTLDYNTAVKMSGSLKLNISEIIVITRSLKDVLEEHVGDKPIDFMSVDVEGHDLIVLKSNNWDKFRPDLLIIESNNDFEEIRNYLISNDYLHIFSNYYNSIFINMLTKNATLLSKLHWNN